MKRNIIRVLAGLGCLLIVTLFVITVYYINEVLVARQGTQTLVAAALKRYGHS